MDSKYGQLYTGDDVAKIVKLALEEYGHREVYDSGVGVVLGHALSLIESQHGGLTFPPDEPLFLLRGKDTCAPDAICADSHETDWCYWMQCKEVGAPPAHLVGIEDAAEAMRHWQGNNPDRTKAPD